jgi:hypothetical protein
MRGENYFAYGIDPGGNVVALKGRDGAPSIMSLR